MPCGFGYVCWHIVAPERSFVPPMKETAALPSQPRSTPERALATTVVLVMNAAEGGSTKMRIAAALFWLSGYRHPDPTLEVFLPAYSTPTKSSCVIGSSNPSK